VYATARRPETIADLEYWGCTPLPLAVCDEASRRAAVGAVEEAEGAVGVLVNNAGGRAAHQRAPLRGAPLRHRRGRDRARSRQVALGALQSLHPLTERDSPYASLDAAVKRRIRAAYEGPLATVVPGPDAVARVIEKAISRARDRRGYPLPTVMR
jgi:NAD(P)-dependent dehydrogenase (short-subunit alcohol dehydrogenase family)